MNKYDKKGEQHGYWEEHETNRYFFNDGGEQLYCRGTYIHGVEEGYWEIFHNNGKLKWSGTYIRGIEVGCWKRFGTKGKIKELIFYIL